MKNRFDKATASRNPWPALAAEDAEGTSLPTHEQIAQRAYEIYLASGAQQGRCERNWLEAERELIGQYVARVKQDRNAQRQDTRAEDDGEWEDEIGSSGLHLAYTDEETAQVR